MTIYIVKNTVLLYYECRYLDFYGLVLYFFKVATPVDKMQPYFLYKNFTR